MPAYADLVRDHHATVYRVALGVLRDPAAAEDVAQDVFLSFLEDPGALDRAENLRAFVCRTSLNRALDVRKAGKRRAARESAFNEKRETMDPMQAAFRCELREKVAALPEDQRQAVDLHYFQGLTLREAGLALEVPEGTVSSRISAALGRLRTVLGAAAFAGLLAMLESELGKCAAEVVVPVDLPGRLLRLRPRAISSPRPIVSGSDRSAAKSGLTRRAGAAGVLAALLLVALFPLRSFLRRNQGPIEKSAGAAEVASGTKAPALTKAGPDLKAPSVPPAPADDPALLEREGFVVEFFHEGKICLNDCTVPDPLTLQALLDGPGGHIFARPSAMPYFEDPGPLRDAGIGEFGGFGKWLEGNQAFEQAPRVWAKVKYQALGAARGGVKSKCVKVLERDELSKAWLDAWLELGQVNRALRDETAEAPGQDKRIRLLALEVRLRKAIVAARDARPKGALAAWSRDRERSWASASAGILRRMGCGRELPAFPTESQLTEIALRAANPGALRDEVVGQFGEDALEENAFFVVPSKNEGDFAFTTEWYRMSKLAAMPVAEFDALRTRIASVNPEQRAEAMTHVGGLHSRPPAPSPRAEALGIHGAQLEDFDAERLALECGVEIKAVDDGSAAARAGLKAGDVLWKLLMKKQGQNAPPPKPVKDGEKEETTPDIEVGALIQNLHWLDYLLENEELARPEVVRFLVLRGGEVITFEVRR